MKRIANTRFLKFIRRHKIISAVIFVIILGLLFILRPKQPPKVETVTVQRGDITQSISSTGSIDSLNSVNLSFQMGGKLVYLGAKAGDTVSAGETIATLDQRQMQDNLTNALRDYSKQRNTFDQTVQDNGGRTPEGALNDDMKRILENNQYDLDKAVISVDLQNLAKEQSVLTTPIAGIVTRADVQTTGVNVTPATVFTVSDPNSLVFKVDVDEADVGTVKLGQEMKVNLDAYPDKTFTLTVNHIDFASHTTSTGGTAYTVQADFPASTDLAYRLGMQGDVDIITNQKKDVLTVPLASIIQDHYVYVKTQKGFVKRSITTGVSSDTETEVTSGLTAGEKVALDPTAASKQVAKPKK